MECPYCRTENAENASKCAACGSWIVERPPVREWTRSLDGRRLGGVCRGLADRFGVPVAALRLLFLGSVFFGGWGVLVYLALWAALPVAAPRLGSGPVKVPPLAAEEPSVGEPLVPVVAAPIAAAEVGPSP